MLQQRALANALPAASSGSVGRRDVQLDGCHVSGVMRKEKIRQGGCEVEIFLGTNEHNAEWLRYIG